MQQRKKYYIAGLILLFATFLLTACGVPMSQKEMDEMKIQETVGRYLDGYAMNDAELILDTVAIEDERKEDFKGILDQFLSVVHRDPYTMRIAYEITDMEVVEDLARIKISAVLRVLEDETELFSFRLFKNKELTLLKDDLGEWKIDYKQFIPDELLKVEFLF